MASLPNGIKCRVGWSGRINHNYLVTRKKKTWEDGDVVYLTKSVRIKFRS